MSLTLEVSFRIPNTEYSLEFLQAMLNRVSTGFYTYGPAEKVFPSEINALACVESRINKYKKTKNKEFLVDAANFIMLEFMYPIYRNAFYKATASKESPGRVWNSGEVSRRMNDLTPAIE